MLDEAVLREAIGFTPDGDDALTRLRDALVDRLEQRTHRLWSRRVGRVEEFSKDPTRPVKELGLTLWPIETITKVEVRGLDEIAWTELPEVDEEWKLAVDAKGDRRVLRRLGGSWETEVRVTYTGGYTNDPGAGQHATPAGAVEALLIQAKFSVQRNAHDKVAVSSLQNQGASTSFLSPQDHPDFKKFCVYNERIW